MVLKVHHLRPAPGAKKTKTRKGRGEASKGKTAGRGGKGTHARNCLLYTSPSPRDTERSRMPSSA